MGFDNFYFVREAFQAKDIEKSMSLIKSYLEKNIGINLYQMPGLDYFKNSKGEGQGIRYILPDNRQIRFNFSILNLIVVY